MWGGDFPGATIAFSFWKTNGETALRQGVETALKQDFRRRNAHQILLVVGLQPQPEAGVMAQHPLQPFGSVGRDRRSAFEQFVHMLGAEIQSLGQLGAGPADLLQDLLNQIPGGRGPVGVEGISDGFSQGKSPPFDTKNITLSVIGVNAIGINGYEAESLAEGLNSV